MGENINNMNQTRVLLWSHPRSRSTAFEFCMGSLGSSVQLFHEQYVFANYFGEERQKMNFPREIPVIPGYKFADVKRKLEAEYVGKQVVFAKDMAMVLKDRGRDCLPRGYVHTFLIREPKASYVSYFKGFVKRKQLDLLAKKDPEDIVKENGLGYHHLSELFDYATKDLGQPAIVIDSDELCENPEPILRKYCEMTGIAFTEKLLSWTPNVDHWEELSKAGALRLWHETAINSSKFEKPSKNSKDFEQLPESCQHIATESQKYYDHLYSKSIKI